MALAMGAHTWPNASATPNRSLVAPIEIATIQAVATIQPSGVSTCDRIWQTTEVPASPPNRGLQREGADSLRQRYKLERADTCPAPLAPSLQRCGGMTQAELESVQTAQLWALESGLVSGHHAGPFPCFVPT